MRDRYQLIIFDWDGTLVNSIEWIVRCLQHAANAVGLPEPPPDRAKAVIGLSIQAAMADLFPSLDARLIPELTAAYRDLYVSHTITPDDLFPGVVDLLAQLRQRGYRLAVATGKGRDGLSQALQGTELVDFFDATRCADETASKPHPRMLDELMAELKAGPDVTLMIGDSVHDLRMARNAGVDPVGVTCGANRREELALLNPLLCLDRTAELIGHLV